MLLFTVYTNVGDKYGASGFARINIRSDPISMKSVIRQVNIKESSYPAIIFTIENNTPYIYLSRLGTNDSGTWVLTQIFNTYLNDTAITYAESVSSISTNYSEKIVASLQ